MIYHAEDTSKDQQIVALEKRIAELEAALGVAQIDPQFAILTRQGIDQRWHTRPAQADTVIFFDIDWLHDHNTRWGYAGTDGRIATAMEQIGSSWVFRWFSGDEFGVLCAAPDAPGFAARVQGLLRAQGMSATFGIAPITNADLRASVAAAAALVQTAKSLGRRGSINSTGELSWMAPALEMAAFSMRTEAGDEEKEADIMAPWRDYSRIILVVGCERMPFRLLREALPQLVPCMVLTAPDADAAQRIAHVIQLALIVLDEQALPDGDAARIGQFRADAALGAVPLVLYHGDPPQGTNTSLTLFDQSGQLMHLRSWDLVDCIMGLLLS